MLDKNGIELKTGQVVKIEGGYFKADNGYFRICHSPNNEDWNGSDYCLKKVNKKDFSDSKTKYSTAFYPLSITVNSREKYILAKEHNKQHSTIEVIGAVKTYKIKTIGDYWRNDIEQILYCTDPELEELKTKERTKIEILETFEPQKKEEPQQDQAITEPRQEHEQKQITEGADQTMNKTLYFEGAGMDYKNDISDVGNYRIRTAFTNNDGKQIYLEMGNTPQRDEKGKTISEWGTRIDHVFYITENNTSNNDSNKNSIEFDWQQIRTCEYTTKRITSIINNLCNCSFDNVEVLPYLAGYRVFGDNYKYNFSDNFNHDIKLTDLRKEIYQHFYNLERSEGKQYPNFSLWVDESDINILHLLRHFNGYNKHWSINTSLENWKDSITEAKLGRYAC